MHMPIVTIQQSAGRTAKQRKELVHGITEAFGKCYGLAPEAVTIFFQEFQDDQWGKDGKLQVDRVKK
jgi:4-oxalocrotonate tautomerase